MPMCNFPFVCPADVLGTHPGPVRTYLTGPVVSPPGGVLDGGDFVSGICRACIMRLRRKLISFSEKVEALSIVSLPEATVLVAEGIFTFPFVFLVVRVCVVPVVRNVDTEPVDMGSELLGAF